MPARGELPPPHFMLPQPNTLFSHFLSYFLTDLEWKKNGGLGWKTSNPFFSFPVSLEPNNWKPHFPLPFSSPIAILALLQPTQHKSLSSTPKEQTPCLQMTSTATPPITTTTPTTTNLVRALPQWVETAIWGASGPTTRGKGGETGLNIMTRNASHRMKKIVKIVQEGCSVERAMTIMIQSVGFFHN